MCLSVNLFELFQLGFRASWVCWIMSFIKFGKYLATVASNILATPFSPLPLRSHYIHISMFGGITQSFRICSFLLYVPQISSLSSTTQILSLLAQICCWLSLMNCSFYLLYFPTSKFLFMSFLEFPFLYWYSLFGEKSFSCFPLVLKNVF